MEARQHQGKGLKYLVVQPDGYDPQVGYPLVILLHGFGANMHDLAGLCPAIDQKGYLYVCPNAPLPLQVGPGMEGYGWTPPWGRSTPEDARHAVELLETFFDEVIEQYHVSPGRIVLTGFSQGGSMAYRCGLVRPDIFAGLAALSAAISDPEELRQRLPPERNQPIFVAHGIHDDIAPVERARQARDFLEGEGYSPDYREYPMRHEISQQVLDDLVPWIHRVLPAAGT